jgi:hypothetical protein
MHFSRIARFLMGPTAIRFFIGVWGLSSLCASPGLAKRVPVTLPSGTKIKVETGGELRSNVARVGDEVVYYVKEPVLSPGKIVLIKKGARATGKVTRSKRARSLGRKGKLEFTVEQVEGVDGQQIPLRSSLAKNGKGRGGTVVAVSLLLSPVAVFIKGKNVVVPVGTPIEAYVDDDHRIAVWQPDPKPVRRKR